MTDEQKAEDYIIAKYKLNECYIEDTEETRVYMRNNVHSEYQQEYECYLDGLKAGREETKENKCKNKHVCSDKGQCVPCYKVNVCEYCNLWESEK